MKGLIKLCRSILKIDHFYLFLLMNITENSISIENLKFLYLECDIDLENSIYEGEGSCSLSEQGIAFQLGEDELYVDFDVYASGKIYEDKGDYWNPPYCDINIYKIEININNVYINGDEFNLNKESIVVLKEIIKNNIQ